MWLNGDLRQHGDGGQRGHQHDDVVRGHFGVRARAGARARTGAACVSLVEQVYGARRAKKRGGRRTVKIDKGTQKMALLMKCVASLCDCAPYRYSSSSAASVFSKRSQLTYTIRSRVLLAVKSSRSTGACRRCSLAPPSPPPHPRRTRAGGAAIQRIVLAATFEAQ